MPYRPYREGYRPIPAPEVPPAPEVIHHIIERQAPPVAPEVVYVPVPGPERIVQLPPEPLAPLEMWEVPEVPRQVEEKTSARKKKLPPVEEKTSAPQQPEVQSSAPGGSSAQRRKLKLFNGRGGRKHTEKQIEEILDWYLQTGGLPQYVSDRQRRSYKHHRTLPERRQLLAQQGKHIVVPEVSANQGNIIPLARPIAASGRRTGGSI